MRRPDAAPLARLLERPARRPLLVLVAVQWVAIALGAISLAHDGWLWAGGGTGGVTHWATGWLVVHGNLPATGDEPVWSLLLAPLGWIFGPSLAAGAPALVVLQAALLAPVALLCVYGIASGIAGRLWGYLAAVAWIVLPWLAAPVMQHTFVDPTYTITYFLGWRDPFLPQLLGLTATPLYPAMVALAAAGLFVVRAWRGGGTADALLAGGATGLAFATEHSAWLFLPAPFVALALARRWRCLAAVAAGIVPALLLVLVWKLRSLGTLPFETPPFDLGAFRRFEEQLGTYVWSVRFLEALAVLGLLALARRSPVALALVGLWLAAFVVGKLASPLPSIPDRTFLQPLIPAAPAIVVALACIPVLVPRIGNRLADRWPEPVAALGRRPLRLAAAAAAAVWLLLLLGALLPAPLQASASPPALRLAGALVPVDSGIGLRAAGRTLTWSRTGSGTGSIRWVVYRSAVACARTSAADPCALVGAQVGTSAVPAFTVRTPGDYRVAVVTGGTTVLLSAAARAR